MQLLRRMRQLLGDSATAVEGPLIREPFLQRLPTNVRTVLASSAADKTLEEMAELADKIVDIASPSVSAVTPSGSMDSLRAEVKHLTDLVSTLATRSRSPGTRMRSPSIGRRRPRLRSPPPLPSATSTRCWYYRRFGDRPRNCTPTCDMSGNDMASRQR